MDTKNLQSTDAKKVWETPTLTEIKKSEILGASTNAGDGGSLLT